MGKRNRVSKAKKIKPHFWVFCEGKTEEAYVKHLRSLYRIPIEIAPKIVGNKITGQNELNILKIHRQMCIY